MTKRFFVKIGAIALLTLGTLSNEGWNVLADENPCQMSCNSGYQNCLQNAYEQFDYCYAQAEIARAQCEIDCDNNPYWNGCYPDCANSFYNARDNCHAAGITATYYCETAYTACYNNCEP